MRARKVVVASIVILGAIAFSAWLSLRDDLGHLRVIFRDAEKRDTPPLVIAALIAAEDPDHFSHA